MPHRCVHCNLLYSDGAKEILQGCSCGAKLFLYVKKKHVEDGKKLISNLSSNEREQIASDILEIANIKPEEIESDKPVILDFESIRVLKPGQYEVDLVHLFKNDPLVFKLEEGKYVIDLAQAFGRKDKD